MQVLDGDELRRHPGFRYGFSRKERIAHLQRVVYMCNLLAKSGTLVIASFVSPYECVRMFARRSIRNFVEVYVKCSIEACVKRDTKGLYKKARAGEITNMTGIQDPYEEPKHPDIIVNTEELTPEEASDKIVTWLDTNLKRRRAEHRMLN